MAVRPEEQAKHVTPSSRRLSESCIRCKYMDCVEV